MSNVWAKFIHYQVDSFFPLIYIKSLHILGIYIIQSCYHRGTSQMILRSDSNFSAIPSSFLLQCVKRWSLLEMIAQGKIQDHHWNIHRCKTKANAPRRPILELYLMSWMFVAYSFGLCMPLTCQISAILDLTPFSDVSIFALHSGKKKVERIRRMPCNGIAALGAFGIAEGNPFRDCIGSLLIDLEG